MGRLAQINVYRALTSVVTAIVLGLSLLVVSGSVSQAARPTGDTTPPTVRTVVPADNATGAAPTTNVEATFSEAMNASTITNVSGASTTFTLAKVGTTNPVAARVTYDPATTKATLDPNADLDPGAKYTATVKGGKKGVMDLAGNWLRDNRTWSFTIAAPPPSAERTVALTFDDGPQLNSTPQILDTLRDYNVDATFFVLGQRVNALPDLVRREYAEGHSVQNHSYTHPHLTWLSETEVQRELADTNAAIEAAGLPRPYRFRPPYGDTNATVEMVGQSLGLTQTLWDASPEDWEGASASTICSRVVQGVKPGSVVVLHDASAEDGVSVYNTNDALPCIINTLRQNGYRFVTM